VCNGLQGQATVIGSGLPAEMNHHYLCVENQTKTKHQLKRKDEKRSKHKTMKSYFLMEFTTVPLLSNEFII